MTMPHFHSLNTTMVAVHSGSFSGSGRAALWKDPGRIILSVVVPTYNEEENIDIFLKRIECILVDLVEEFGGRYEILCVDDGSEDQTVEKLIFHRTRNPSIKILCLSRNFGKEIALSAGLDHSEGAAVVPIDVDLQDPPEVIPKLFEKWLEGYDVVYATRDSRTTDSLVKRTTSSWFYRVYNTLSDTSIPNDTGDFRIMDRRVIDALRVLPERNRFMKGLFSWVGFRQTGVNYQREPRVHGKSKWKYWKLWNFALDGIASNSTLPLRMWTYLGLIISILAFGYAGFLIIKLVAMGVDTPGYASLMVTILFMGGINILTLGIIGEYLGRIYTEVKGRPLYLVRQSYGLNSTR